MGLGYYGPRFRAVLQGEVNLAALADEVVNPPVEDVNQGNDVDHPPVEVLNQGNVVGLREVENANNGIEVLAEAATMNIDDQNAVEDNIEGVHAVVIGLAAVPLDAEGGHVLVEGEAPNEL